MQALASRYAAAAAAAAAADAAAAARVACSPVPGTYSCRLQPPAAASATGPAAIQPNYLIPRCGCQPSLSAQVIMDITGVLITCATCHLVLDQLAAGLKVA